MSDRGRAGGFTLLEIMCALAILAVGSICILSTFAAALALHMRREADVRGARVLEEAQARAQEIWDSWRPTKERPFPPSEENVAYGRDTAYSYSVSFQAADGQPRGLDGTAAGAVAVLRVVREGAEGRPRVLKVFLTRSGFRPEEMKESWTYEREKRADKMKQYDPGEKKPR